MRRFLTTALIVGVCSTFGLMGCADESKVKETQTISGPGGTTEVNKETSVESSGSNPPAVVPSDTTTPPVK